MRRIVTIVVVGVVALIGGVLWWMTHDQRAPRPRDDAAHGELPTPVERARLAESDPRGPLPTLDDDDPHGALRLDGQVVDAHGTPVDGATVTLTSSPSRTATTSEDGTFSFTNLVARRYTLAARAPQGVAGPVEAAVVATTTTPVVLHLHPGGTVIATVVGTDAKPIDAATVELRGIDKQTGLTAAGEVTFAPVIPGFYEIVAWSAGMARTYQGVRVSTGEVRVRLVLAPGAAAEGRVVDQDGKPVAGAHVLAMPQGQRARRDAQLDAVPTGGDGGFAFDALPAGSFRFTASQPRGDHAAGSSSLVTLDGVTKKTGIVIALSAGATVRGHVVDTTKQPVAGAQVRIAESRGGRGWRGGRGSPAHQAYTDDTGAFEIHGLPRGQLAATASHDRGSSTETPVDTTGGNIAELTLSLDLTLTISGVVADPLGNAIEGAQVFATLSQAAGITGPALGAGGPPTRELTDTSGHFKLTGLAAGHYSLHASRGPPMFQRGRRPASSVEADAGATDVHLVLAAEGAVKATVQFADGSAPSVVIATIGSIEQSFAGGAVALDGIPPGDYTLSVRGSQFDTKGTDVTIASSKTTDAGVLVVAQGRRLAGLVEANGSPVAGATVYAGRRVTGNGSTSSAAGTGMGNSGGGGGPNAGQGAKTDTTGPDGSFSLAGFGDGDLTIVAELPAIGRSKAMLIAPNSSTQQQIVLELQPYGSVSGVLRQAQSSAGTAVTAQSTTTPGAMYVVNAGADGAYRFDRLAPDTYKVSATLGTPRRGVHFYSQQVDLPPGGNVTVDLSVDAGDVTVSVTPQPASGTAGTALGYLASTAVTATTAHELALELASAGAGSSQMTVAREGGPASFTLVAPGNYTACLVPLPAEIQANQAAGYVDRHGGALAAFCMPIVVVAQPAIQAATIQVVVPPLLK